MSKIYVVTSGAYSDYHIDGVYSTLELAQKAHQLFCADNDVEEYELDDFADVPPGMLWFQVLMDREGNVESVVQESMKYSRGEWLGYLNKPYPRFREGSELFVFGMWAKDETHAIKIANERRVALIVNGEWDTQVNARKK